MSFHRIRFWNSPNPHPPNLKLVPQALHPSKIAHLISLTSTNQQYISLSSSILIAILLGELVQLLSSAAPEKSRKSNARLVHSRRDPAQGPASFCASTSTHFSFMQQSGRGYSRTLPDERVVRISQDASNFDFFSLSRVWIICFRPSTRIA
jgi:hypothetical protein